MRITIIEADGLVAVDGVFRAVDLSDLDPAITAIQFDTAKGRGHIEWDGEDVLDGEGAVIGRARKENTVLDAAAFAPYQVYVDRWTAAAPAPLTPEEIAARNAFLARLALDDAERLQAKVDSVIMSLCDATPAERITWARNNFPSLTLVEQNRLGMLLNILAVAVRPQVRG